MFDAAWELTGTAGFWFGCLVAFPAGVAFAVCRRAWRDYRGGKKLVKLARKAAWRSIPRAAIGIAAIAIISFLLIRVVILNPDVNPATVAPGPARSAAPSPS